LNRVGGFENVAEIASSGFAPGVGVGQLDLDGKN
jgi:hypothetical protein